MRGSRFQVQSNTQNCIQRFRAHDGSRQKVATPAHRELSWLVFVLFRDIEIPPFSPYIVTMHE